jgi:hypothetical protein
MAQRNLILSNAAWNLDSHILEEHMACIIRVEATSTLKMEAVSFSTTSIYLLQGSKHFQKNLGAALKL